MDDPAEITVADQPRRTAPRETSAPAVRRPGRLVGRVTLITGAGSGIGRAAAIRFAREGADVAFTHLSRHAEAQQLVRAVEREGRACLALCGDVDDPGFCEAAVVAVLARFGGVDVLVHDFAARRGLPSCFALFLLARRLLPHLRERPGASVLCTADVRAGEELRAAIGAYRRVLAANLARARIVVDAVVPGSDGADDLGADELVQLASEAAAGMNGERLDARAH